MGAKKAWGIAALCAGCAAAGGALAFHHWASGVDLGAMAAASVRAKMGLELTESSAKWSLLPSPGAEFEDASLKSSWRGSPVEMARARSVRAKLSWAALLRGRLEVESISVSGGAIAIEQDARGDSAWSRAFAKLAESKELAKEAAGGAPPKPSPWADLGRVAISKMGVSLSRAGGASRSWTLSEVDARRDGSKWEWSGQADAAGQMAAIHGDFAPAAGRPGAFEGSAFASAPGWSLHARGSAAGASSIRAEVQMQADDLASLGAAAGYGGWSGSGSASGELARDGRAWSMAFDSIKWGAWSGKGSASWDASGERPLAGFDLAFAGPGSSPALPAAQGSQERAAPAPGKLPWSALEGFDAKGRLALVEVPFMGGAATLSADVALDSGVLALANVAGGASGGKLQGVARAVAKDRSVEFDFSLSGMSVESLMAAQGRASSVKGGPFEARARMRMSGSTEAELRSTMAGDLTAKMGRATVVSGAASGLSELMGAWMPGSGGGSGPFEVECAGARMAIAGGVGRGSPLIGVEGPALSALGSGSVDFGAKTLDLGLDIEPKGGLDLADVSALASAFRLAGPWSSPRLSLDPSRTGSGLASIGAAAATGGVSLLAQALAKKVDPGPGACAVALRAAPAPSVARGAQNAVQKIPDALASGLEKLRGLFGR